MAKQRILRASAEFECADLGDERLTKRVKKTAETLAASPASSLPRAAANERELEGVYRFLSNARMTPRGILEPHFAASTRRAGRGPRHRRARHDELRVPREGEARGARMVQERLPRAARARRSADGAAAIGERVARLRKERGITQLEVAELLGGSQPNVSDYERGEFRLHGELLAKLARILKVSADEILGLEASRPARAPRDRRLLRRLQDLDRLSKRDRDALMRTLDAFLAKAQPG